MREGVLLADGKRVNTHLDGSSVGRQATKRKGTA